MIQDTYNGLGWRDGCAHHRPLGGSTSCTYIFHAIHKGDLAKLGSLQTAIGHHHGILKIHASIANLPTPASKGHFQNTREQPRTQYTSLLHAFPDTKRISISIVVFNPPHLAIRNAPQTQQHVIGPCSLGVSHKYSICRCQILSTNSHPQSTVAHQVQGFCRARGLW